MSVVFIERRGAETKLLYTPCSHVPDITNQSLYLLLMSLYKYLRTVQNRSPTVMADRSELACPYWLDWELVWGVEVVTEEPSREPIGGTVDRVHW